MTEDNARTLANLILGLAVVGAAYAIARTPRLRRLAWGLLGTAVTGTIPAWLGRELHTAWTRSGQRGI
jgi:hypothetical protein